MEILRTKNHSKLPHSPFYAVYGVHPNTRIENLERYEFEVGLDEKETTGLEEPVTIDLIEEHENLCEEIYKIKKKALQQFREGSIVYYFQSNNNPDSKNKIIPKFKGPYFVVRKINNDCCDIIGFGKLGTKRIVSKNNMIVIDKHIMFAFRGGSVTKTDF